MRKDSKNAEVTEMKEKALKLCSGYSSLDDKDQEHIFGVLQALLFTKLKMEMSKNTSLQSKGES